MNWLAVNCSCGELTSVISSVVNYSAVSCLWWIVFGNRKKLVLLLKTIPIVQNEWTSFKMNLDDSYLKHAQCPIENQRNIVQNVRFCMLLFLAIFSMEWPQLCFLATTLKMKFRKKNYNLHWTNILNRRLLRNHLKQLKINQECWSSFKRDKNTSINYSLLVWYGRFFL
jgi:hypothetical protein